MKIRHCLLITVVLIASLTRASHAAPLEKRLVSNTADWVLHLDAHRFWQTEIISRIIEEILGTDPMTDIDAITFYGPDADLSEATIVLKSDLDSETIVALLEKNPEYEKYTYNGSHVHRWDDGIMFYGTFPTSDQVILSPSQTSLEYGLRVFNNEEPNIKGDETFTMLGKVPDEAFITAFSKATGDIIAEHSDVEIPGGAQSLTYAMEKEGILQVKSIIKTEDEQTAHMLEQLLSGLIAMAGLSPDLIRLEPLIQALDVNKKDRTVNIEFSYPSGKIFDTFKEAKSLSRGEL